MRRRYLVVSRYAGLRESDRGCIADRLGSSEGLSLRFDSDELVVFAETSLSLNRSGNAVVLGSVFDRGASIARTVLDEADMHAIVASGGQHLIERHWGTYVALLPVVDGGLDVVRAPFSDLGCYHFFDDGLWLIASDAGLLRQASTRKIAINWTALARSLGRGEMMGAETCLNELNEVRGGDRVTLAPDGSVGSMSLWSPWAFAREPYDDEQEALRDLRGSVKVAVQGAVSSCRYVLVMLSGGLDSSIVSACLKDANARFGSMTLVSEDAGGDERDYAHLVAAACGVPLVEVDRDSCAVDMLHSSAALLPRPAARSFTQESERSTAALAIRDGAQAIVDGGGGDNVFCSHRSVAAVADCLLTEGFGPNFWKTAAALGGLAEAAVPTVAWRAVRRAWFRRRATRPPIDISLLSANAREIALGQLDHPWLAVPHGTLPGKAVHIALLAVAQAIVESSYQPDAIARLSPLMSQPVVETCLRIPSWMWFAPVGDRAAARHAFAADLPAAIINRRSKGSPNMFAAGLIDRNRETLRAMLLDGMLAAEGMIDTDAIRRLLDDPAPVRSYQFTRILRLADVEAWARAWR